MAMRRPRRRTAFSRAKRRGTIVKRQRQYRAAVTRNRVGSELKFVDCGFNGITIGAAVALTGAGCELYPNSGISGCISAPAQGDGDQERDGKNYILKSADFSGVVDHFTLSDQPDVYDNGGYFFAMVLDKQTNGLAFNSEDVFLNPINTVGLGCFPYPLRNLTNSKRFKILDSKFVDQKGMFSGSDGTGTLSFGPMTRVPVSLHWKGSIKVSSLLGTASVAAVSDNSISILAYAMNTNFTPTFFGKSRVRFIG